MNRPVVHDEGERPAVRPCALVRAAQKVNPRGIEEGEPAEVEDDLTAVARLDVVQLRLDRRDVRHLEIAFEGDDVVVTPARASDAEPVDSKVTLGMWCGYGQAAVSLPLPNRNCAREAERAGAPSERIPSLPGGPARSVTSASGGRGASAARVSLLHGRSVLRPSPPGCPPSREG